MSLLKLRMAALVALLACAVNSFPLLAIATFPMAFRASRRGYRFFSREVYAAGMGQYGETWKKRVKSCGKGMAGLSA